MNRKVRAIIVDGTKIMTSLTETEIADRLRTYDDLKDEIKRLNNSIGKTTNYYLKTLAKNKSMPDEAVKMYNYLEGNIR